MLPACGICFFASIQKKILGANYFSFILTYTILCVNIICQFINAFFQITPAFKKVM